MDCTSADAAEVQSVRRGKARVVGVRLSFVDAIERRAPREESRRGRPVPGASSDKRNPGSRSSRGAIRAIGEPDQREDEAIPVSPGQSAAIPRTPRLQAGITLNRRRFILGGAAVVVSAAGSILLGEELLRSPSPQPLSVKRTPVPKPGSDAISKRTSSRLNN
jgi:hypothetical protein